MKHYIGPTNPMHAQFDALASYQAQHFAYAFEAGVATLTLNRPERKNPLTFESYAELLAQLGAHLLFDQLREGEHAQPQAQGFGVFAVASCFHVHDKPFVGGTVRCTP